MIIVDVQTLIVSFSLLEDLHELDDLSTIKNFYFSLNFIN